MCGRFMLTAPAEALTEQFSLKAAPPLAPRYNIAPTQPVLIIRALSSHTREAALVSWGLIPAWHKNRMEAPLKPMINARGETLDEKPSFKNAFRYRRCLVPADGFYEWSGKQEARSTHWIGLGERALFAFAGIWESWQSTDGSVVESLAIITVAANKLMAPIHHRMPVILPPEHYGLWLGEGTPRATELKALLVPFPAETMTTQTVGAYVNNPRHEGPQCLEK